MLIDFILFLKPSSTENNLHQRKRKSELLIYHGSEGEEKKVTLTQPHLYWRELKQVHFYGKERKSKAKQTKEGKYERKYFIGDSSTKKYAPKERRRKSNLNAP